jgi:hypothetical protein
VKDCINKFYKFFCIFSVAILTDFFCVSLITYFAFELVFALLADILLMWKDVVCILFFKARK